MHDQNMTRDDIQCLDSAAIFKDFSASYMRVQNENQRLQTDLDAARASEKTLRNLISLIDAKAKGYTMHHASYEDDSKQRLQTALDSKQRLQTALDDARASEESLHKQISTLIDANAQLTAALLSFYAARDC